MRIGLVCPYPWDVPGGVMAHVRDLAVELRACGHEVGVLAPVRAADAVGLEPWLTDAGKPVPIPYNGSVARLLLGPVSAARTRRWVRDGRWDLLHVHEPMAPSVTMPALVLAEVPVVATFHSSNARSRLYAAFEPVLRPAFEKINARIAVSPAARRTVVEHLGGDAVEIPNGVALERFQRAVPDQGSGPVVAFVGRVDEPRKGLSVLLDAWPTVLRSYPDALLRVAGPGDWPDDVPDRVEVLGQVAEDAKASLLAGATVFAAPNLGGESFGIVLLEALACGAPVVASDLEAFRAVLAEGTAGVLVPPGEAAALAGAIIELLGDPARRAELVARGAQRAADFDWRIVAQRVIAVYEAVLG